VLEATVLGLASVLAANVRAASVATKRLTPRSQNLPLGRFLDEYVRAQRRRWTARDQGQPGSLPRRPLGEVVVRATVDGPLAARRPVGPEGGRPSTMGLPIPGHTL
jgi:hypothetical protein